MFAMFSAFSSLTTSTYVWNSFLMFSASCCCVSTFFETNFPTHVAMVAPSLSSFAFISFLNLSASFCCMSTFILIKFSTHSVMVASVLSSFSFISFASCIIFFSKLCVVFCCFSFFAIKFSTCLTILRHSLGQRGYCSIYIYIYIYII